MAKSLALLAVALLGVAAVTAQYEASTVKCGLAGDSSDCDGKTPNARCCTSVDDKDYTYACGNVSDRPELVCLATARGDPVFTGFDGVTFDFNGLPYTYWNLLAERDHVLNAFFAPAVMYDHNGTYMTAFGFQYDVHRIAVRVEEDGRLQVELNDEPLRMAHNENELTLKLGNSARPEAGALTISWELYSPGRGQVVTIMTPMLTFECHAILPGTLDEGGIAQPAYLDSSYMLTAAPTDNKMQGVVGLTYVRLVNRVVHGAERLPRHKLGIEQVPELQVQGLFDRPVALTKPSRRSLIDVSLPVTAVPTFPVTARLAGRPL